MKATLCIAAAIGTLAVLAPAGLAATRVAAPCGVVSSTGGKWYLTVSGMTCGTASRLLHRIAGMTVRPNHVVCDESSSDPRFRCGYPKLKCQTTSKPGKRPTMLACFVGANHTKGFGAQNL